MNETERAIFSGMRMLLDQQWVTGKAVVMEGRQIKAIVPEEMIKNHLPARRYEFAAEDYLIPGLIDLHIHGAHGWDVMDGTPESLLAISRSLAAEGVTGFLPTTMSADNAQIEKVLKNIAAVAPQTAGAKIMGAHLEGPFLSREKCGAQCGTHLLAPDASLIHAWQKMSNDAIRLVTLAPELPGALELIAVLQKMKIVSSIGHSNATYDETRAAIEAGCMQATHLFNAMSGIHQRHPGAVTALLLSEHVSAELIVDGLHLHPAIVDLAYRLKGRDRLLLVTDAMRAKCLGDGEYDLGGQTVAVIAGKPMLSDGTLAGSTLRMSQAIKNMAAFTKCPLEDAIRMASYNPAKVLGLATHKGSIAVGKDADLVVMGADFSVKLTVCEGKDVFRG